MTREERECAISYFERRREMGLEDRVQDMENIAIEALQAEPCENAVSVEDVITIVARKHLFKDKSDFDKCVHTIAKQIKALPPVTPKPRWIPVDYDRYPETYPKPFQEVWITDGYGEVIHKAYDGTRSIKAWMPYIKPEPYKEGESE